MHRNHRIGLFACGSAFPRPKLIFGGILAVVLAGGASLLPAQPASSDSSRIVPVTVTDGLHRFVTGLAQEHFELLENGTARALGRFANPDDPIAIATLSDPTAPSVNQLMGADDELIQASSLPEALRQLAASKHFRKALVLPSGADLQAVPPGIQVLRADPAHLNKAVVELRNTYWLHSQTFDPSARIEVVLKQPRGLPVLKAGWKNPF